MTALDHAKRYLRLYLDARRAGDNDLALIYAETAVRYGALGTGACDVSGKHTRPIDCPDHKPVQHRDGKPPWCRTCGLTADGTRPVSGISDRPT